MGFQGKAGGDDHNSNFCQFSLMITRFDKEIHSITINDDEIWQKDAILNWTLHSICNQRALIGAQDAL